MMDLVINDAPRNVAIDHGKQRATLEGIAMLKVQITASVSLMNFNVQSGSDRCNSIIDFGLDLRDCTVGPIQEINGGGGVVPTDIRFSSGWCFYTDIRSQKHTVFIFHTCVAPS